MVLLNNFLSLRFYFMFNFMRAMALYMMVAVCGQKILPVSFFFGKEYFCPRNDGGDARMSCSA
jgi:hypothetical protein